MLSTTDTDDAPDTNADDDPSSDNTRGIKHPSTKGAKNRRYRAAKSKKRAAIQATKITALAEDAALQQALAAMAIVNDDDADAMPTLLTRSAAGYESSEDESEAPTLITRSQAGYESETDDESDINQFVEEHINRDNNGNPIRPKIPDGFDDDLEGDMPELQPRGYASSSEDESDDEQPTRPIARKKKGSRSKGSGPTGSNPSADRPIARKKAPPKPTATQTDVENPRQRVQSYRTSVAGTGSLELARSSSDLPGILRSSPGDETQPARSVQPTEPEQPVQQPAEPKQPETNIELDMLPTPGAISAEFLAEPYDGFICPYYVEVCLGEARNIQINKGFVKHKLKDAEPLVPNFGFISPDRVRLTLDNTSQLYRATEYGNKIKRHHKSRWPGATTPRLNEDVATDSYFSDTPAADDGIAGHGGCTMLQIYTGTKSRVSEGFPMSSESDIPETLLSMIRKRGAMDRLISDNAKAATSTVIKKILNMYMIKDWQSEPHYQNQNPAERRIQDIKRMVDGIMARTGTPKRFWLLCVLFVIMLMNHIVLESLGNQAPLTVATGQPTDVSPFMEYRWWEPVTFEDDEGEETIGRWVGPIENCGDILTYQILSGESEHVVFRSDIRTLTDPAKPNLRAEAALLEQLQSADGEGPEPAIFTASELLQGAENPTDVKLPKFSPDELLGLSFLNKRDDGQKLRATIVRKLISDDENNTKRIRFLIQMGDGADTVDDVMTYTELCDIIEEQHANETDRAQDPSSLHLYTKILAHQGPLHPKHRDYKGSIYNLLLQWGDESETYEPLNIMAADDPITVANYGLTHGLLDKPGWKRLKRFTRHGKKFRRMVNQAKRKSKRSAPVYKYGLRVPQNGIKEARLIDTDNGNTLFGDAIQRELDEINSLNTFSDQGAGAAKWKALKDADYTQVHLHWVFDIKPDLRHKARLVASGNMTPPSMGGTYSSVVSLRSMRLVLTLAELNGLNVMVGDISNAYLMAKTTEKVFFIAGPEFGELEGHVMIIVKALYGLRRSGAAYHAFFSDTMRSLGFTPCLADQDVWMRDAGDCWEYVCTYVDDLCVCLKDPQAFFDELESPKHGYTLKGVGEPDIHLGGNFYRDPDGTLAWGAKKYISRIMENYQNMYKELPKKQNTPIEQDDHPELDTSPELGPEQVEIYQSLIGCLQWAVTLGRIDIMIATMTLSRFRPAPRQGHMVRLHRVLGYLRKFDHGAIRFRTGIPDHETTYSSQEFNWDHTVYGNVKEERPPNAPEPKGKFVRTTTQVDANLLGCLVTGRSTTGILHFLNQTPVAWFSKRQNTVETATFGSEFVAARQASEQIIELRYDLMMLGANLEDKSWLFGDNESVVNSASLPDSKLTKRHIILSYHRVRECIAAKFIDFHHIPGVENLSDVLTKFLPHSVSWPLMEPLLFWRGDTADCQSSSMRGVTSGKAKAGVIESLLA